MLRTSNGHVSWYITRRSARRVSVSRSPREGEAPEVITAEVIDAVRMQGKSWSPREGEAHGTLVC